MAEAYNFQSTYAYAANNPISNIDILGMAAASTQELLDKVWEQGNGTYDNDGNRTGGNSNGGGWPDIGSIVSNMVSSFWQSLGFSKEDAPTTSETMAFAIEKEGQLQTVVDGQTAFIPGGSLLNPSSSESDVALDFAGIFLPGLKFVDKTKSVVKFSDEVVEFAQKAIDGTASKISAKIPEGFTVVKGTKSHGQKVYSNGKTFITPDTDGHIGGIWKAGKSLRDLGSKSKRLGTYNANLEKIGG